MRAKPSSTEFAAPPHLSMRYTELDGNDVAWSILLAVVFFVVFMVWGAVPYGLYVLVFYLISMIRLNSGRLYQTVADEVMNTGLLLFRKGYIWRSKEKSTYPDLPFGTVIELLEEAGEDDTGKMRYTSQGLIPLGRNDTYGVILLGDGAATATQPIRSQHNNMTDLGRRLQVKSNVGISWVFRTRPPNLWPLRDYYGLALNPYVFKPESEAEFAAWARQSPGFGGTVSDPGRRKRHQLLHRLAEETQQVYAERGREVTMAMPIVISGNEKLSKKNAETIDVRALKSSPIIRTARQHVLNLRTYGVSNARIATAAETLAFVRSTWDSKGMPAYYDAQHAGKANSVEGTEHLPSKYIKAGRDYIEIDGNFIGIVCAQSMPELINPLSFHSLFSLLGDDGRPISMTLATVGATINARKEAWIIEKAIDLREAFFSWYSGSGRRSYRAKERTNLDEERSRQLGRAHYRIHNFNVLAVIHAESLDDLEADVQVAMEAFDAKGLRPARIKGPQQMQRALWSSSGFNVM